MPVSAIYIVDLMGKLLISRDYRHSHAPEAIDRFMPALVAREGTAPVLRVDDVTFAYVRTCNVYVVASVRGAALLSLVFVFLHRTVRLMRDYFREVQEESVRDNFVLLYEILDEIMDFGYPQITDSSVLMEYITQESKQLKRTVPDAVTNAVSWRPAGIKYKKNEVFLDVVESVCMTAKCDGCVIRSEVNGSIRITSRLSGMPELHLGLNDRLVPSVSHDHDEEAEGVDLQELRFHQCVRLTRFDRDRSITFVPPDGEFELMSYRINAYIKPPLWVECVARQASHRRLEYTVKVTSHFLSRHSASLVHILVPVPGDVDSPKFQFGVGSVTYVPESNVMKWAIKNLQGYKEHFMIAQFGLPSVTGKDKEALPPIEVQFEIPAYSISGLNVRFLKVTEKSGYQSLPWVRYVTQAGEYQIRQREPLPLRRRPR